MRTDRKFLLQKFFRAARPVALVSACLLFVLLVVSLVSVVKLTLPRGYQAWLRAGELGYAVPSGRYAELTANSASFTLSVEFGLSFDAWRAAAIRRSRSGTWIQSFLWFPLLPPTSLCSAAAVTLHLLVRRRDPGRCGVCGYSRTGLPAASPCPECGQTAA